MEKAVYKELARSKIQPGEWEYPVPLANEWATTRPTPTQVENDQLGTTAGNIPMIKTWDLAEVDPQSFDPFEPPGRPPAAPMGPVPIVAPVVSGAVVTGNTLITTNGTWTGNPTPTYTRQWRRNTTNIPGATGQTYNLVVADEDAMISCNVTATNSEGAVTTSSNEVGPVVGPPRNTTAPVVSGNTVTGNVLTTTNGTWTGSPTYARQWLRGAANIGTGGLTYALVAADEGAMISCRVTATNAHGNAPATSNAVGPITPTAEDPEAQPVKPRNGRHR